MKIIITCMVCVFCSCIVNAQNSDSIIVLQINQQIDDLVVKADTFAISKFYSNDFVFNHGSGRVDSKSTWLISVAKGSFIYRTHDSVKVELHPNFAIVRGKLNIQKQNKEKKDNYYLWYIRVYDKSNKLWQMSSHNTYFEKHL